MRTQLLICLFLFFTLNASAVTYYVASNGNDSNSGQSTSTAWKTLSKVNSKMSSFKPGDKILFRRGDIFYGGLQVTVSGSSSKPIIFGAYGTGDLPIFAGYKTLSNWTPLAGYPNVWQANYTWSQSTIASFFINDKPYGIGRYPNLDQAQGGYLIYDSFVGRSQIKSSQLPTSTDWTGAELVLRATRWVLDKSPILSHNVTTRTVYIDPSFITVDLRDDHGFFIQNHLKTLDKNYEWAYNTASKKVYVYLDSGNPNELNTKISHQKNLITLISVKHITVENLHLTMSNEESIFIDRGERLRVSNCKIDFSGCDAIAASTNTKNTVIENNQIEDANSMGITFSFSSDNNLISNNTLKRIGCVAGMGTSGGASYSAITAGGSYSTVQYNEIDSVGYVGIHFSSEYATIQNNFIKNTGLIKNDGGAIYTHTFNYAGNDGSKILNNIIMNVFGNANGTNTPTLRLCAGIYIDGFSGNMEISGNTIAHSRQYGLYLHNSINTFVTHNTFFSNATQIYFGNDNASQGRPMTGNTVNHNTFVAMNGWQYFNKYALINDDIKNIATYNGNYYLNPFSDYNNFTYTSNKVFPNETPRVTENLSLQQLKSRYAIEQDSKSQPTTFPTYQINSLLSANYARNPNFNSTSNYWSSYSSSGASPNVRRVTNSPMGNALLISFNSFSGRNRSVGAYFRTEASVSKGNKYLLKFDAASKNSKHSIDVIFRKHGTSYEDLDGTVSVPVSTSPKKYEVLFEANSSSSDARIDFIVQEQDSLFWIDNVEFYKVDASFTNDSQSLTKLFHNPSSNTTNQALDDYYIDKEGTLVSGSIPIPPYGSVVLLKSLEPTEAWLESECASAVGTSWEIITDSDASNGNAVRVKSGFNSLNSPPQDPNNWVRFDFEITQAANYKIQARIKTPNSTSDSFWIRMDNGNWVRWSDNVLFQNYTWATLPGIFNLSRGSHSLYFAYRESEAILDKIYVSVKDTTLQGTGAIDYSCCPIEGTPCNDGNPFTINDAEDGSCNCVGLSTTDTWLEAECPDVLGNAWEVKSDAEASNESYITAQTGINNMSVPTNSNHILTYNFTVAEDKNYDLWARILTPSSTDDSFWIKIDNQNWIAWHASIAGEYEWQQLPLGELNLQAGSHTISFGIREDGARLDKVLITSSPSSPPTALGENAANCGNSSNPIPITEISADTWLEAECPSVLGSAWQVKSDANASNTSYITAQAGINNMSIPTNSNHILTYNFTVAENQNYDIWARILTPNSTDDSFWIKIDNQNWIAWHTNITGEYEWQQLPLGELNLQAGSHTISFGIREDGARLDKVLVTSSTSSPPTALGENAANCGNSGIIILNTEIPADTWLEAECPSVLGSAWQVKSDANASNTSYITAQAGINNMSIPTNSNHILTYNFTVAENQNYDIWARILTPNSTDDSFWIKIDNQNWIAWHTNITGEYEWQQLPLGELNLQAGSHTISFGIREDGARLDKVLVTSSASSPPTALGENTINCGQKRSANTEIKGEEDIPQVTIQIAPNPVSDLAEIRFETGRAGDITNNVLTLYSTQGILMKQWTGLSAKEIIYTNLSELASGIYFLRLSTPEKEYQIKLIKL